MYLPYDIKLYTILHINSSHSNFEDIVNVNRPVCLSVCFCCLLSRKQRSCETQVQKKHWRCCISAILCLVNNFQLQCFSAFKLRVGDHHGTIS